MNSDELFGCHLHHDIKLEMIQRVYSSEKITIKRKKSLLSKLDADEFIKLCCEVSIPTYENKKNCFEKFFKLENVRGLGPE